MYAEEAAILPVFDAPKFPKADSLVPITLEGPDAVKTPDCNCIPGVIGSASTTLSEDIKGYNPPLP